MISLLIILHLLYLPWIIRIVWFSILCELLEMEYTECSGMWLHPFY